MSRILELPEPVYNALVEAARSSGLEPADWIASRLPGEAASSQSNGERFAARERLLRHAGSISLGRPTGTENEAIDADLAREYSDPHEDVS